MEFFNALKRVLSHERPSHPSEETQRRLRDAWGLDTGKEASKQREESEGPGGHASSYDRDKWRKRLKRVLDGLPETRKDWDVLVADAHALALETDWVSEQQREAFDFLIRRAVADRVVSEEEHHTLEMARKLIGMSEIDAETALHRITAEAESFFGFPVKDEG